MDIKSVIKKYGETTYTIAQKMGIAQPSVMQYINGNPTARKLEDLARAIGCSPAEFFADWSEPLRPEAQQPSEKEKMDAGHDCGTNGKQTPEEANDLPFGPADAPQPEPDAMPAQMVGLVRCPRCGAAIRLYSEG